MRTAQRKPADHVAVSLSVRGCATVLAACADIKHGGAIYMPPPRSSVMLADYRGVEATGKAMAAALASAPCDSALLAKDLGAVDDAIVKATTDASASSPQDLQRMSTMTDSTPRF